MFLEEHPAWPSLPSPSSVSWRAAAGLWNKKAIISSSSWQNGRNIETKNIAVTIFTTVSRVINNLSSWSISWKRKRLFHWLDIKPPPACWPLGALEELPVAWWADWPAVQDKIKDNRKIKLEHKKKKENSPKKVWQELAGAYSACY